MILTLYHHSASVHALTLNTTVDIVEFIVIETKLIRHSFAGAAPDNFLLPFQIGRFLSSSPQSLMMHDSPKSIHKPHKYMCTPLVVRGQELMNIHAYNLMIMYRGHPPASAFCSTF